MLPTLLFNTTECMGYEIVQQEKLFTILIYTRSNTFIHNETIFANGLARHFGYAVVVIDVYHGDEDAIFFLMQDKFNKHLLQTLLV